MWPLQPPPWVRFPYVPIAGHTGIPSQPPSWPQPIAITPAFMLPTPANGHRCAVCLNECTYGEPQLHFPAKTESQTSATVHMTCCRTANTWGRSDLKAVSVTTAKKYKFREDKYIGQPEFMGLVKLCQTSVPSFNGFEANTQYVFEQEIKARIEEYVLSGSSKARKRKKKASDDSPIFATTATSESDSSPKCCNHSKPSDSSPECCNHSKPSDSSPKCCNHSKISSPVPSECSTSTCSTSSTESSGSKSPSDLASPASPGAPASTARTSGGSELNKSVDDRRTYERPSKRQRVKRTFLSDAQAQEWNTPKNPNKANGMNRLQRELSNLYRKYMSKKNALFFQKQKNAKLQAENDRLNEQVLRELTERENERSRKRKQKGRARRQRTT